MGAHGTESPLLCFAGHTDVVPTGPREEWQTDPFEPTVKDGVLYGRGAADMKSGLAAMVTATERFLARHPTIAERSPFSDQRRRRSLRGWHPRVMEVLEGRSEKIDWCIVGEPTSTEALGDTLKIGRRGSLSGKLTVHGVQGHVAYPHLADNPVHALLPALAELTHRIWDKGNDFFQPTTFQVSNINAGTGAPNVIPGELKARFNIRFSTEQSVEKLQQTITEILDRHKVNFTLEWFVSGLPFFTAPGVSRTRCQRGSRTWRAGPRNFDDGRNVRRTVHRYDGRTVVELGVINATIHKVNECVRIADIDPLSKMYERIIELLLRQGPRHQE